jgi:hypothetical protein
MTYYVHTDDLRPRQLPKSWHNVSGLNLLSDAELRDLGWYPWENTPQPEHDLIHQYLEGSVEIQGDKAVQVWTPTRRAVIPTVEQVATDQVRIIKSAAGEAILARLPYHRQLNFQQRAIELLDTRRQRELTAQELADYEHIVAERNWLESMRAESNRLEGGVAAIVAAQDLTDDEKRTAIATLTFEALP